MTAEQHKAATRRFIERGFNQHDFSEFEAYFSPELVDHALPPNMPQGLEGRKTLAAMFFRAFPDIATTIEDLVAEGDKVVTRWSVRGTHRGELMGIPPTGKQVTVTGMAIDRFENGASVEHWEIFDQLGLLQQLGAIPAPS
ncbi:MAG: ester cyclase [Ardenticatenaceae bacterium]|nr:ester cyclase [Ardenticatenaceae bacterium]HBY97984.1 ester cyclase [Chloroflexota bacterium]